jgi:hypothetical protein
LKDRDLDQNQIQALEKERLHTAEDIELEVQACRKKRDGI